MLVGIAGTGLIGCSIGLGCKAVGYATAGWDRVPAAAARAAELGAVDRVAASLESLAAQAETVVLTAPLEATVAMLQDFPKRSSATLIVDVASVKLPVVAAGSSVPFFVASHPLAGSERAGPDAARADLFRGRVWAYVPPADEALERRATAFFAALGATALAVDAAQHDAIVAFTSHLPQLVATALGATLAERLDEDHVPELCGSGMRSMTRLASSQWSVWRGVLAANTPAVSERVRAFAGILQDIADALDARDEATVHGYFARAAIGAAALEREQGRSLPRYSWNERHDEPR